MAVDGQRFMTKTQHYRKVTKPLLERKRRARMNLYLDELKDLIVDTMEAQGEHVTKLEKADILELTVNYLKSHKHEIATEPAKSTNNDINLEKFRAGYTQAAYEVSKVFATSPGLNIQFGTQLIKRLGYQLSDFHQSPLNMSCKSEDIQNTLVKVKEENSDNVENVENAENALLPADNDENQEYKHKKIRMRLELNAPKEGAEDVWRPW